MSIFKQTLAPEIQDQLKVRTNVVNGNGRPSNFPSALNSPGRNQLLPWYLSKNSWVRMTSMVNFTSGTASFVGDGTIKVQSDGRWTDDQLSRRYILEGGTLYAKENNGVEIEAALRENIGSAGGSYGGNFDVDGNGQANKYSRQFGIRPMPGITSVNLHTVGAYGSIFETTVKFYAWDTKQLNDLEILFMRPGYSVLLEWGWSQYIDNNNIPQVFNGQTINAFSKLTQQDIYDKLETLRKKYDHNYDGMLGYVKNFSWKLMPNGGYDCTTTLISMGEVINSLKISTNNLKLNNSTPDFDFDKKTNYVYDDYENLLISMKWTSEKKYFTYLTSSFGEDRNGNVIDENTYRGSWDYTKNYVSRQSIEQKLKNNGYDAIAENLTSQPLVKKIYAGDPKSPLEHGQYYEYLSLDIVMAIMDSYFNIVVTSEKNKNTTTNPQKPAKIIPPGNTDYCLAGKDSISVDPRICLVSNPLAFQEEFVIGLNPLISDPKEALGVTPPVQQTLRNPDSERLYRNDEFITMGPFYNPTLQVGYLSRIYINIDLLLDEYKNLKNSANDTGVNFIIYMKNVLNKVSSALGGLNNFILSTAGRDQNLLRIVDTYYLEKNNKKYEFDLIGLGSICRSVDIESQIFPEQSTIVAIAAQSKANLGDVYNSTQVYLNAGIEDRVALAKFQPGEEDNQSLKGNPSNPFYQKLFEFLLYVRDNIVGAKLEDSYSISTSNTGTVPSTFLKQFMLNYNGDMNFKALIPFKLTIKLDGIGGIIVGEIFKVKQNVLPQNYYDKNLGFIITKISHDLVKNDWETTLETQICLLDNDKFKDFLVINREGFKEYLKIGAKEAIIYPAIINFAIYQALKSFVILIQATRKEYKKLGQSQPPLTVIPNLLKNYGNQASSDVIKVWLNQITTLNNYDLSNNDGLVGDYGINQLDNWLNTYNNLFLASLTTDQKALKVGDETLQDAVNGSISNSTLINEIQSKLNDNINMFAEPQIWDGVFRKTLDQKAKENNGKNAQIFDYVRLTENIESELVSRGILTNTFKQQYYRLPLVEGSLQPELNPIESKIFYDDQNSLYQRFDLYQIVTNYIRGDFQYNMKVSDKSIVEEYYDIIPNPLISKEEFLNESFLFNNVYLNF